MLLGSLAVQASQRVRCLRVGTPRAAWWRLLTKFYPGFFSEPTEWIRFSTQQIWHADFNTSVPSFPNFQILNGARFKFGFCERADVGKCMYRGNSSNGMPKSTQGLWWQEGLLKVNDEELVSSAGRYNPQTRLLTITAMTAPRNWGAHDTVNVYVPGLFWAPAGTGHLNMAAALGSEIEFVLNEDFTFAQIVAVFHIFGFPVSLPTWWLNWTMKLLPDGSWARDSDTLGYPTVPYTLRQIITGDGEKGLYFDEWVKARDGRPFIFLDNV
eukprot:jgi/Botrbrau1/12909/Bobra.0299s0020.1